jgi:predicted histidine transporter YuiF (NhaC family)
MLMLVASNNETCTNRNEIIRHKQRMNKENVICLCVIVCLLYALIAYLQNQRNNTSNTEQQSENNIHCRRRTLAYMDYSLKNEVSVIEKNCVFIISLVIVQFLMYKVKKINASNTLLYD